MVAVVVLPVMPPGLIVQLPAGNPLSTTDPDARAQVGWVMAPTIGAVGVEDPAAMVTLADAGDTHPAAFVTAKL